MTDEEYNNSSSPITRRDFIGVAGAATALVSCGAATFLKSPILAVAQSKSSLGEWLEDENGLPCFHYTGPLSFHVRMKNGELVRVKTMAKGYSRPYIPHDPYFLLGNYRLTLFVHASGLFQILTGERAWGRMNQGDNDFSGANHAAVEIAEKRYELVGPETSFAAIADKLFGVGFARYRYPVTASVEITRTISVRPSKKPGDGTSAFLVTVRLRNLGKTAVSAIYTESVRAKYDMIVDERSGVYDMTSDRGSNPRYRISYSAEVVRESYGILRADFYPHPERGVTFSSERMSRLEGAPPSLFVKADDDKGLHPFAEKDAAGHDLVGVRSEVQLPSGGEKMLTFVVGYSRDKSAHAITALAVAAGENTPIAAAHAASVFGKEWANVVPAFNDEPDATLRREMRWDAAVLEAMATYRDYYEETAVPQGTLYDYVWGIWCVNRDFAQHGLPVCHTNPALAKSILRFIMKRMLRDGEIKGEDMGFGWVWPGGQGSSDQQLYFFGSAQQSVRKCNLRGFLECDVFALEA